MPSVNFHPLQFALREMQALARRPTTWLVLAAISIVMGLVGPFGTFEMPVGARLAYWAIIVVVTGCLGTLVEMVVVALLPDAMPSQMAAALGGAVAGLPIAGTVWAINLLAFGASADNIGFLTLLVYCIPIAAVVTALGYRLRVISARPPAEVREPSAAPQPPALLDRLPLPQRGRLLHLAVNDHYVDVTTDKGTTLVLIRLSDAMRETAPTPGLQVHRSHWVALDAVRRSLRRDGKPVLELESGAVVPVSRTYLADARDAGLLG